MMMRQSGTVCPRSLDPFYTVSCVIKYVKTSLDTLYTVQWTVYPTNTLWGLILYRGSISGLDRKKLCEI